jgi:hypothetical protein
MDSTERAQGKVTWKLADVLVLLWGNGLQARYAPGSHAPGQQQCG